MAASMNVLMLIRGQYQKILLSRLLSVKYQCRYVSTDNETELIDPDFNEEEYKRKLAKIRDCSGLNSKQKSIHYRKMPEVIFTEKYRGNKRNKLRKIYAEHGESSGISPSIMYPSRAELSDLWDIENNWTQSFQQMKTNLEEKKAAEIEADRLRYEKIERNMAGMDKLIQKYHDKQRKVEEDAVKKDRTEYLLDEFKEQYGYNVTLDSSRFKIFKRLKSEEMKLQKAKQKKEEKKASSTKNLKAILEKEISQKSS